MVMIQRTTYYPDGRQVGGLAREHSLAAALFTLIGDAPLVLYRSFWRDGLIIHHRPSFVSDSMTVYTYQGDPTELNLFERLLKLAEEYRQYPVDSLVGDLILPDGRRMLGLADAEFVPLAGAFPVAPWQVLTVLGAFQLPYHYDTVRYYADPSRLRQLIAYAMTCGSPRAPQNASRPLAAVA